MKTGPNQRRKRHAGFTLLEAIVALVIFSMGALALYSWLGVNLKTLDRVESRREAVALTRSALDQVRRVNPMETPRGRRKLGEILIEWESRPIEPERNAVSQLGFPTIFKVGLFAVQVRVSRGATELERFQVRQVGYKQTGSMDEE